MAEDLSALVAACDVIWTCLEDDKAVLEVFAEILKLDLNNKLFVECSTILPDATCNLARKIKDKDANMVAMPGSFLFAHCSMYRSAT